MKESLANQQYLQNDFWPTCLSHKNMLGVLLILYTVHDIMTLQVTNTVLYIHLMAETRQKSLFLAFCAYIDFKNHMAWPLCESNCKVIIK